MTDKAKTIEHQFKCGNGHKFIIIVDHGHMHRIPTVMPCFIDYCSVWAYRIADQKTEIDKQAAELNEH